MHQNHQSLQIVKDYQIDLVPITEWEGQADLVRQIGKVPSEVVYLINLRKVKSVQGLIIELEPQFVLDLQIEAECKIGLEFLPGLSVGQAVLIIVQGFHLA